MIPRCLVAALLSAALRAQTPVVVELFTSEGCSSCPPADILLAKLEEIQPVAGAHIIALSEHVDYWNSQGWRDPFSAVQFTFRQRDYSAAFHDNGPYTPQMVIDGVTGFVGSNQREALEAIAEAARKPKAAVSVTSAPGIVSIKAAPVATPADVLLAITESGLSSNVSAGENGGRRLTHTAVVRSLRVVGKMRSNEPFTADVAVRPAKSWNPGMLRAVVFLRDRSGHKVLAAADGALVSH